ncbi:hypothetical protein [Natronolimnobius sp. AArcel1]|nr:hypothetical protein [Natronolimnobius sp. AArcel1]
MYDLADFQRRIEPRNKWGNSYVDDQLGDDLDASELDESDEE